MRYNFVFSDINGALPILLDNLLKYGSEVDSRIGPTKELAFTGITLLRPLQRELLIPGRKHNFAAQIAETMWVLAGRNDVEWLSRYLPRAKDYSDDGATWRSGYGPRIRRYNEWASKPIDQLGYVVETLRANPGSRQAVINIWDPEVDSTPGKDIACNNWLHFLSRDGKLDLHVSVRSNDAMWGWSGINVFEWSTLLEMVAGMTQLSVGELHFSISSFHLYEKHWEKAARIAEDGPRSQQLPSPRFNATGLDDMESFDYMMQAWFLIEAEIRRQVEHGMVGDLADIIDEFPEPMLRSWLRVIAWWWTGNRNWIEPFNGTDLYASATVSVQPKPKTFDEVIGFDGLKQPPLALATIPDSNGSIEKIIALHNEKNAAYGDSWCKRGEMLGIMANIARKVDRIESGKDTNDETQADTAIDLFVYLAKYLAWIQNDGHPDLHRSNEIMREYAENDSTLDKNEIIASIPGAFAGLEMAVVNNGNREICIDDLLELAWNLVTLS